MRHLVLIGACYLDTILNVPYYPEEDSKLRATSIDVRRGGNCPNSLEVLQQLLRDEDKVQLYLASCLPEKSSIATKRVLASFDNDGKSKINFDHCIYRSDHTEAASSYIIRSEKGASRTIVNYNGLPELTVDEFGSIVNHFKPDQDTWWHFEGRIPDVTLECIRLIKRNLPSANVSVEVEKPGREGLQELAVECDVTFYSRTWAEHRGYKSAEMCLKSENNGKASISCCPWGADGAAAISHVDGKFVFCPVNTSNSITVRDAVGAGDTFIAGMLHGLVLNTTGRTLQQKLQYAVDLATLKVQQEGFSGLGEASSGLCTP